MRLNDVRAAILVTLLGLVPASAAADGKKTGNSVFGGRATVLLKTSASRFKNMVLHGIRTEDQQKDSLVNSSAKTTSSRTNVGSRMQNLQDTAQQYAEMGTVSIVGWGISALVMHSAGLLTHNPMYFEVAKSFTAAGVASGAIAVTAKAIKHKAASRLHNLNHSPTHR